MAKFRSRRSRSRCACAPRRWSQLSPGLLAALIAAALAGQPALAQSAAPGQQQPAAAALGWNLPAGPLSSTLLQIARISGQPISVPPELVRGLNAPAVSGRLTAEEAVRAAIAGQPLELARTANGTLTLRSQPRQAGAGNEAMLPAVDVRSAAETATSPVPGYIAQRSATGTKTDTPLIETPQSVAVVTRDQMDSQGAQTVAESLRYTAGVLSGSNGGQTRFDSVFVRGFGGMSDEANYTSYVDGLGWPHITRNAVQIDPFALERVEVLRGPSSVLFGQADPGGFVNLISKQPTVEPLRELMLQLGNHDNKALGLDLGGALNADGSLSYRLTGLARDSRTGVDFQKDQRQFVAPAIRWAPSADTSLTLRAFYQHDPNQPDTSFVPYQFAGVGGSLSPYGKLPMSYFQGDPSFDRFTRTIKTVGWEFEHRFNPVWQFRHSLRYGTFNSDTHQISNNEVAADFLTVSRYAIRYLTDVDTLATDNQLQARFRTGPAEHTLLTGLDWRRSNFSSDYGYHFNVPDQTVYAPVYGYSIPPVDFLQHTGADADQLGLYVQDQVRIGQWALLGGLRHDDARSTTDVTRISNGATRSTETSDQATSGRLGAVYLMPNGFAPYASYTTSFNPVVGATDRLGQPFKPTEGKQLEAGVRWQPQGSRSMITASVYELKKTNVLTTDPVDINYSVQTGGIRSRGVELEGRLELDRNTNLLASYSHSDVAVTDTTNPAALGKRPVAAPASLASVWLDYRFASLNLPKFTAGAGVRYVGDTFADDANTIRVPSYTLFDAMLRYDFDPAVSLTINFKNLANRQYAASCAYGTCWQGTGRSMLATLRYRW